MKVTVEIVPDLSEEEITIRCSEMSGKVLGIHNYIMDTLKIGSSIVGEKSGEDFFLKPENILFFETGNDTIYAHTDSDAYIVRYKLYELLEMLPSLFVRVSKSAIINIKHISSISKNFPSASLVRFHSSPKALYVSRMYYKALMTRLHEELKK